MDDAPHIVICFPVTEQIRSTKVARVLTARGLRISQVSDSTQLQSLSAFAAICVGITSRESDTPLIGAAFAAAMATQRPIFPLLLHEQRDMPSYLQETQWSDFTGTEWLGWRDLLLALDMEGLSRWPFDSSVFDEDVVLARAQNGLTPLGWQTYRGFSRVTHYITNKTLFLCASVVIFSLLAWAINPSNWVAYLLLGGLYLLVTADGSRWKLWGYSKNGPIIVITPQGFLSLASTGCESFSFAMLRSIDIEEAEPDDDPKLTRLVMRRNTGVKYILAIPEIYDTGLTPFLQFPPKKSLEIAKAVVAAFQQAQQHSSTAVANVNKPLVFLSYAHSDESVVSTMESTVRSSGLEPWLDHSRLRAGMRWKQEIRTAIQQCSALIVVISPDSVKSDWVRFECGTARELNKPVIGVVIKACDSIPPWIPPDMRVEMRMRRGGLHDYYPVLYALNRVGVLPEELTTHRERAPLFVLARAMAGAPLPDEQVFFGGWVSFIGAFQIAVISIGIFAVALLFPILVFPAYLASFVFTYLWVNNIPYRQELIVIFPTGIAQLKYGRTGVVTFIASDDWRILRSTVGGTTCQLQEKRFVEIPGRFHEHRQIAERMIQAFQRSQR